MVTFRPNRTVSLGELVAAAFDQAARWSTDQRAVARIATRATAGLLSRLEARRGRAPAPRPRPDSALRIL